MPRAGPRGRSPGDLGAPPPPVPPPSQMPLKCFFALNMFAAMACAMHGKSDGVLLMCLAVFVMAMAMQYCLDLQEDDEANAVKFVVGIAVVWGCSYQLHAVKVHTSLASVSAGASADHAKLKQVLAHVPGCLEAANLCREGRERTAYLSSLDWSNATEENGASLDWPAWLFVVMK